MILAFDDASGLGLGRHAAGSAAGNDDRVDGDGDVGGLGDDQHPLLCLPQFVVRESRWQRRESTALVPAPPRFSREFAESLMEFALMGQAIAFDQVILATDAIRDRWGPGELDAAVRSRRRIDVAVAGIAGRKWAGAMRSIVTWKT